MYGRNLHGCADSESLSFSTDRIRITGVVIRIRFTARMLMYSTFLWRKVFCSCLWGRTSHKLPPFSHIKRQATRRDCLQGCWAMGTHTMNKCAVRKKIFCSGLTTAAKAGSKSLVPARRAQWANQWKAPFICTVHGEFQPLTQYMKEASPFTSTWWRPTPYPVHDGGQPLTQYMMEANPLLSIWWRPSPYPVHDGGKPLTQYTMEANPLLSTRWRPTPYPVHAGGQPLTQYTVETNPLPSTWWRPTPYPVHDGGQPLTQYMMEANFLPSTWWRSNPPWWHTGKRWAWRRRCCRRRWFHYLDPENLDLVLPINLKWYVEIIKEDEVFWKKVNFISELTQKRK